MKRCVFQLVLILAALTTGGCIHRSITITSEPAGALVVLNDEEVGRTPVTVPFLFYGVYDVRLQKEGFRTLNAAGRADAPWWEIPPLDLIAETGSVKVKFNWHYALEPRSLDTNTEGLIDRAQSLRQSLNNEDAGKTPPPVPAEPAKP